MLADVVFGFTQRETTPLLFFDSEKETKGLGPIIHGWAHDAFNASQRELVWAYVSHGLPGPEPRFVRPASHPCLEFADFVSFVVARAHFCRLEGRPQTFPTERLGRVFYSWIRPDGNYGRDRVVGFPWDQMYQSPMDKRPNNSPPPGRRPPARPDPSGSPPGPSSGGPRL